MSAPTIRIVRAAPVTAIPGARFESGDVLRCAICGQIVPPVIFQALSTGELRIVCIPHQRVPSLS